MESVENPKDVVLWDELARQTAEKVWDSGMLTMPSIEQIILSALQKVDKEVKEQCYRRTGYSLGEE